MRPILIAFGRAVLSQLHFKMLMLTVLPFVLSVAVWGVALWLGLQPLIDGLQNYFITNDVFRVSGNVLSMFGLGVMKTVLVPLIAMWALLPLMILTALVCIGLIAMPSIVKHVAGRHYPEIEARKGGACWGACGYQHRRLSCLPFCGCSLCHSACFHHWRSSFSRCFGVG